VNVICRVVVVGGEWKGMAMEMIFHILQFIPPFDDDDNGVVVRDDEMRRILSFSTDIRTMGCDKMMFLERVFGKGMGHVLC